jgi:hypothetical protein
MAVDAHLAGDDRSRAGVLSRDISMERPTIVQSGCGLVWLGFFRIQVDIGHACVSSRTRAVDPEQPSARSHASQCSRATHRPAVQRRHLSGARGRRHVEEGGTSLEGILGSQQGGPGSMLRSQSPHTETFLRHYCAFCGGAGQSKANSLTYGRQLISIHRSQHMPY